MKMRKPKKQDVGRAKHAILVKFLKDWRKRMGLSRRSAVKALGCSRQAYADWEDGARPAPLYIELACVCLEHYSLEERYAKLNKERTARYAKSEKTKGKR